MLVLNPGIFAADENLTNSNDATGDDTDSDDVTTATLTKKVKRIVVRRKKKLGDKKNKIPEDFVVGGVARDEGGRDTVGVADDAHVEIPDEAVDQIEDESHSEVQEDVPSLRRVVKRMRKVKAKDDEKKQEKTEGEIEIEKERERQTEMDKEREKEMERQREVMQAKQRERRIEREKERLDENRRRKEKVKELEIQKELEIEKEAKRMESQDKEDVKSSKGETEIKRVIKKVVKRKKKVDNNNGGKDPHKADVELVDASNDQKSVYQNMANSKLQMTGENEVGETVDGEDEHLGAKVGQEETGKRFEEEIITNDESNENIGADSNEPKIKDAVRKVLKKISKSGINVINLSLLY